jgi:ADP-heptose:LPS heptosyltransferase
MSKRQQEIKTILALRFSALGDVALTVPMVKRVLEENPGLDIIMVSDSRMEGIFSGIERLRFVGFDLKGKFKGIRGIYRIYDKLNTSFEFQAVADLHGVLRSYVISFLLWVAGKRVSFIDKGRKEKRALTKTENKIVKPLKHTTERYAEVFRKLGCSASKENFYTLGKGQYSQWFEKTWNVDQQKVHLGFAPFARHMTKMYNLDRFKEVVKYFNREPYRLHLFGGTRAEQLVIQQWEKEFSYVVPYIPGSGFKEELDLMSNLKVMVSLDSANMHLASLVDVPVVSIWGPTHPFTGFYGFNQDLANAIQVDLSCRPCSVFGNKSCWRGDHACMQEIGTDKVIKQVKKIIGE